MTSRTRTRRGATVKQLPVSPLSHGEVIRDRRAQLDEGRVEPVPGTRFIAELSEYSGMYRRERFDRVALHPAAMSEILRLKEDGHRRHQAIPGISISALGRSLLAGIEDGLACAVHMTQDQVGWPFIHGTRWWFFHNRPFALAYDRVDEHARILACVRHDLLRFVDAKRFAAHTAFHALRRGGVFLLARFGVRERPASLEAAANTPGARAIASLLRSARYERFPHYAGFEGASQHLLFMIRDIEDGIFVPDVWAVDPVPAEFLALDLASVAIRVCDCLTIHPPDDE